MRLLDRIRGLTHQGKAAEDAKATRECIHGTLAARWSEAKDMGDESKATEYVCNACQTHFSPEEATWVRKRAVEHLRR